MHHKRLCVAFERTFNLNLMLANDAHCDEKRIIKLCDEKYCQTVIAANKLQIPNFQFYTFYRWQFHIIAILHIKSNRFLAAFRQLYAPNSFNRRINVYWFSIWMKTTTSQHSAVAFFHSRSSHVIFAAVDRISMAYTLYTQSHSSHHHIISPWTLY